MGIMCTPMSKINLMVVVWFIMFGIGGILTFPLIDKIGRRKTSMIFSLGHYFAQALILFQSSFLLRIIGFSLQGFLSATKNSVTYAWLFEFMQKKDKSFASTCLNLGDFLTSMVGGFYFLCISRDWAPLLFFVYFLTLAGLIVIIFICPESPKWLLL